MIVRAGYSGPLICVGALCLSLLYSATAWAKPAAFSVALEYEPGPNCPGTAEIEAAVVERLGYDPFAEDAPNHVSLRIAAKKSSLDGRIEWRDADGRWAGDQSFSMASGDCLHLTRTMALALAVQIQLLNGDLRTSSDAHPEQTSEAKSSTKPVETPSTKPADEARPAPPKVQTSGASGGRSPKTDVPVFGLGVGPAVGFAMAPNPIALGRIFGQVDWQRVSIQLAAEASLPSTFRRADHAGVREQLLLLSLAGCGVFGRWNACLVLDAGNVALAGQAIDHPTSAHLPYVDAGLRAGFSQPLGQRAFINAHADGLVVLSRWTARLDDVPVWTTPPFAAVMGIDIGVQFR